VALDRVGRQADQLDATLGELWLELCESTKLSCAYWCVIFRVGKEDNPVVPNELVEVDGALSSFSLEVWGNGTQSQTLDRLSA
jgi:hypothetical protein